jgi:hypothetical protein
LPGGKLIEVYVRKGASDNERVISWNPPKEIPAREILELGYAIERFSAKRTIMPRPRFGDPNDPDSWKGPIVPLTEALHEAQKALQDWLESKGYTVEFK